MNMEPILAFATGTVVKAIVLALLVYLAHKWSNGDFDKHIKNLKQMGKEYGIVTLFLIVVWWILTPSGLPDDLIAVWLVAQIGVIAYSVGLGALTLYLLWRMRVTIVIYKKK
jgi:hypothetical protein